MAGSTIRREISQTVAGLLGALIICLVTSETVRWRAGIVARYVTFCAVRNLVALGEREEIVFNFISTPAGCL